LVVAAAIAALANGSSWPGRKANDVSEFPAAIHRSSGTACEANERCDRTTGCIAPTPPSGATLDVLPDDGEHGRYVRDLEMFQLCRRLVQLSRSPDLGNIPSLINIGGSGFEESSFAQTVQRWNGTFRWEPASASANTITRLGDEARAVFGPIPDGDCMDGSAKSMPLQVDGNIVDVKPNPDKPGHPLEFEHRDVGGKVVRWTSTIPRCDKPSLAGSSSYCGLNSRLNRVVRGNVEWLTFCRKSSADLEVGPIPYWQRSNPKFALLGIIGFNRRTGETVFFDGRKGRGDFDWSQKFVPPGGHSYEDQQGRAAAESLYDPTFQIQCSACHDNKTVHIVNPNIQLSRVGYFAAKQDPMAAAFSLGDMLPGVRKSRSTPFRIIGSAYTGTYRLEIERARTVQDPTGNCTECHTLTTQMTGQRFAADAVAREPVIAHPKWGQLLRLTAEQKKLRQIDDHRTKWASRAGSGKIHPWMVPVDGNELGALPPEISSSDWQVLSNCLWGAGGSECAYRPLYTLCPAPESAEEGDAFLPADFSLKVDRSPINEANADRMLHLGWRYLNGYGNVPQRDDVRFNVAVRSIDIPASGAAPAAADYPSIEEASGKRFVAAAGEVGVSGSAMLVQNVSYFGHSKFTEPTPSTTLRDFKLNLPAKCNRRYLVRILPKRFCFDQSAVVFGQNDHLLYADVACK
jgi:hypothetical protein